MKKENIIDSLRRKIRSGDGMVIAREWMMTIGPMLFLEGIPVLVHFISPQGYYARDWWGLS